jgi:hypothetical protein
MIKEENLKVIYTKPDINLALVRDGDEVEFSDGFHNIESSWSAQGIFQISVNGKIYSYTLKGEPLTPESPEMLTVVFNNTETDLKPVYTPHLEVSLLPVLTVNGEDKVIYRLTELDGLEVKGDQKLSATYKYTIEAKLYKILMRKKDLVKEEKIIFNSEQECKEKLESIQKALKDVDHDNESVASDQFTEMVHTTATPKLN